MHELEGGMSEVEDREEDMTQGNMYINQNQDKVYEVTQEKEFGRPLE